MTDLDPRVPAPPEADPLDVVDWRAEIEDARRSTRLVGCVVLLNIVLVGAVLAWFLLR